MSSSPSVHSNAFNFLSFVQQGVDPRTGQYTVQLSLPELLANDLAGPSLPLSLSFNPLNGVDRGFGLGFSLALSQFQTQTRMLSLGDGETFKVTGSGAEPQIAERKLDSFRFFDDGGGSYRIVHRSGLMERLTLGGGGVARVVEITSPAGHALKLAYVPFADGQRLESLSDAAGDILRVVRDSSNQWLELLLWPGRGEGGAALARYILRLDAMARVTELILPTENEASWHFNYDEIGGLSYLSEIFTPVGGRETIFYEDAGHPFPQSAGRTPLPRVTRHRLEPGFGQPPVETRYTYSNHNFLGHGTPISWADDGLDNLYKAADRTYAYGSSAQVWAAGVMERKVERSFNRFHLMTEETTTQDNCVKRVNTTYYADLPENITLPFDQQPPQCQLPAKVETRWELTDDPTRLRVEIVETTYDVHGNLLTQKKPDGTREVHDYYPVAGEGQDCPPDPDGFVRSLRSSTVHPDPDAEIGGAPTLRTHYRYNRFLPLPSEHARPFLQPVTETLLHIEAGNEIELQRSESVYFADPTDPFRLARPKSQSQILNGKITRTDYAYTKISSLLLADETVLETVETMTGFDGQQKSLTQQSSLLNGQPLRVEDLNQVSVHYRYDALQRVVSETVAPGTQYEATRSYQYRLVANSAANIKARRNLLAHDEKLLAQRASLLRNKKQPASPGGQPGVRDPAQEAIDAIQTAIHSNAQALRLNGQAEQLTTDVKGLQTRIRFDGLNRSVYEERQDPDNSETPENPPFRQTYAAIYDELSNLVQETHLDWIGKTDLPLTSTYKYDSWGTKTQTKNPNNVTEVEEIDPIGNGEPIAAINRQWQIGTEGEKLAVTETWLNMFGEAVRVERFDINGDSLSVHRRFYDGLGRLAEEIDANGQKTTYGYDAYDRLIQTVLPDSAVTTRVYAGHSDGDLPVQISVNEAVLGEQDFDGLDRMVRSVTGGRERQLSYAPGTSQPMAVVTPSGRTIEYAYILPLGDDPVQRRLSGSTADYDYDTRDARLVGCSESGQELQRRYFSNGHIRSETRKEGGEEFTAHYGYSLLGREYSYTDIFGQTESCTYDNAGRLVTVQNGQTLTRFEYDAFGRVSGKATTDGGRSAIVSFEYDALGRETGRDFYLDGTHQNFVMAYDASDRMTDQTLTADRTVLRSEHFEYDSRGRLEIYECNGSQRPIDPYGKVIERQLFFFDALDNIREVRTSSPEGTNRAVYFYEGDDPAQLTRITNSLSGYPAEIRLIYDDDGNLLVDDRGRGLAYDALGRLQQVSEADGAEVSAYRYDAMDVLTGATSDAALDQRFYRDGELANRIHAGLRTTYLRTDGRILAERKSGTEEDLLLLAGDRKDSITGTAGTSETRRTAYTPYGYPSAEASDVEGGEILDAGIGYNGELHEGETGWQVLGQGYRAYNPILSRFHSPDDQSPFGEGGANSYAYCKGDPVNFKDPSGHNALILLGFVVLAGGATAVALSKRLEKGTVLRSGLEIIGWVAIMLGFLGIGIGITKGGLNSKPRGIHNRRRSRLSAEEENKTDNTGTAVRIPIAPREPPSEAASGLDKGMSVATHLMTPPEASAANAARSRRLADSSRASRSPGNGRTRPPREFSRAEHSQPNLMQVAPQSQTRSSLRDTQNHVRRGEQF